MKRLLCAAFVFVLCASACFGWRPMPETIKYSVFSPDGKRIVTVHYGGTARVWDTETGKELQTWNAYDNIVFSSDGKKVIACGGWAHCNILDADTGKVLHSLEGHTDTIWRAFFSPDGKKVVTHSSDKTIRIWDVESGKELKKLEVPASDIVVYVAFSPDGKKLITSNYSKTVRIWDAESGSVTFGKEIQKIESDADRIECAVFSPDGKKIVLWVTERKDDVRSFSFLFLDAESGKELYKSASIGDFGRGAEPPFSPDGKRMLMLHFFGVLICDVDSGKVLHNIVLRDYNGEVSRGMPQPFATFSSDGKQIFTEMDKEVRFFDTESGKEVRKLVLDWEK